VSFTFVSALYFQVRNSNQERREFITNHEPRPILDEQTNKRVRDEMSDVLSPGRSHTSAPSADPKKHSLPGYLVTTHDAAGAARLSRGTHHALSQLKLVRLAATTTTTIATSSFPSFASTNTTSISTSYYNTVHHLQTTCGPRTSMSLHVQ
jgi:hypothetical protein